MHGQRKQQGIVINKPGKEKTIARKYDPLHKLELGSILG
jgi:hypothetical protein